MISNHKKKKKKKNIIHVWKMKNLVVVVKLIRYIERYELI
jgi:hypothetical protein